MIPTRNVPRYSSTIPSTNRPHIPFCIPLCYSARNLLEIIPRVAVRFSTEISPRFFSEEFSNFFQKNSSNNSYQNAHNYLNKSFYGRPLLLKVKVIDPPRSGSEFRFFFISTDSVLIFSAKLCKVSMRKFVKHFFVISALILEIWLFFCGRLTKNWFINK